MILLQFVRDPATSFQNKCLKMSQHVMKFDIYAKTIIKKQSLQNPGGAEQSSS